jgi:hypothetical protein
VTVPQLTPTPPVLTLASPPSLLRSRGSIVPVLVCPRCSRRLDGVDAESLRTMLECYRRECRQRWWAMGFESGLVEPQLVTVVNPLVAPEIMSDWSLPQFLDRRAFWQIKTTRNQSVEYDRGGSRRLLEYFRTLFRGATNA